MTKKTIERIKNVVLVVLVLITILLLYFFWEGITFDEFSLKRLGVIEEPARHDALEPSDVIAPGKIVICFEPGTAAVISEGRHAYWDSPGADGKDRPEGILQCLRRFSEGENLFVEEIARAEYVSIMEEQSFTALFDYYIPFGDFCDEFGIKKAPGYDSIQAVTRLGYSQSRPESLFVFDKSGNKYFKLTAAAPEQGFSLLLSDMMQQQPPTYVLLSTVVGEGMGGSALIPLELETNLSAFDCSRDFYPDGGSDAAITAMAQMFFGDSLDFVRIVEEGSGSVTYMYGFGERVLIAAADGTFEYKEEEQSGGGQTKYFEALDRALQFTASHGRFVTLDGQSLTPYLKQVVHEPDKKKGFRFVFGLMAGEGEVHYEMGDLLTVDANNTQVTYFKRDFINFDQEKNTGPERECASVVDMLTQQYEVIYQTLTKEGYIQPDQTKEPFNQVMALVDDVRYGYVRIVDDKGEMEAVPAWIVVLAGGEAMACFDLYEGTLLECTVR